MELMADKRGLDRAFAVSWLENGVSNYQQGMTLRDYFAASALIGLSARDLSHDYIAHSAYAIADKMLKERSECILKKA